MSLFILYSICAIYCILSLAAPSYKMLILTYRISGGEKTALQQGNSFPVDFWKKLLVGVLCHQQRAIDIKVNRMSP